MAPLGAFRSYLTQEILPTTPEQSLSTAQFAAENHDYVKLQSAHQIRSTTKTLNDAADSLMPGTAGPSRLVKPMGAGTVRACVLTLMATALGTGVLALPFAFSQAGLGFGIFIMFLAAFLSTISLVILMVASRYSDQKTYSDLLVLASGKSWAGIFLDACLLTYGTSAIMALIIFIGDFVPAVFAAIPGMPVPLRNVAIVVVCAMAWPFVLPSSVSSLRYVAAVSPLFILFMASVVVFEAPGYAENREAPITMLSFENSLKAAPICIFSLMCHMNAVPVAHMLERPTVARFVNVATYAQFSDLALYIAIGVAGYLSFGSDVKGDFLMNYPNDSPLMTSVRMLLTCTCFVGIPINASPSAQAARNIVKALAIGRATKKYDAQCSDVQEAIEKATLDVEQKMEKPWVHAVAGSLVLLVAMSGALVFTDVATLIGLVGGSLTTLQMFWVPAFVYYQILYPTQPKCFRTMVMGLLIFGGILGFASVGATLMALF